MLKSLFKRSTVYFLGLTVSKVLSVVVFILFARTLLPQQFGDFILFVTLIQIITFFGDFGMNQWYQKMAQERDKNLLFSEIISARIFMLGISLVVSWIFLTLVPTFAQTVSLLFLITLIPEAFLSILEGFYLESRKPLRVSLRVSFKMLLLLAGYLFFIEQFRLNSAVYLYLLASTVSVLFLFPWSMIRHFKSASLSAVIRTVKNSSSYAFLIFTSFAYSRGDSLVIRYMLGSTALGFYGTAYRYLESLSLIPTALSQNLFPLAAKKARVTVLHLKKIVLAMFAFGVITASLILFLSDWLILGLVGDAYRASIAPLKIFAGVLLLFFLNAPLAAVVQSSNLMKNFLPWGILNTAGNIVLNLIFIPIYGINGAAWVMFTTEATGLLINMYFVKRLYKNPRISNFL